MKKLFLVLFYSGIIILSYRFTFAQGVSQPLIAESKYFSVYCDRSIDIYALVKNLNFEYLIYADNLSRSGDDLRGMLVGNLDGLYLAVSDVLDIHIYSYHGKLSIFPDQASLRAFLKQTYGLNLTERSYYFHDDNIIYISFADLTQEVLGHEIAHAIISHYFVVVPPAKVQEILCGYVEYTLRKTSTAVP